MDLVLDSLPVWQVDASCADDRVDPAIFYPERGQDGRKAREVCASCPVSEQCLEYALETRQEFGIWGGLSERQRRRHQGRHLRLVAS